MRTFIKHDNQNIQSPFVTQRILKNDIERCSMSLTYSKKLALYLDGNYSTPTPSTSTKEWTIRNWIDFIDKDGCWCLNK